MFGIGMPELIIILMCCIPGGIGAWLAGNKGRSKFVWFLLCAVLPLLIVVIIFLKPAKEVAGKIKQCPLCKEFIKWDATVCRYCHSAIESADK